MNRVFAILLSLSLAFGAFANVTIKAQHCGTRGNFLGALASDLLIPDYFPPEQFLVRTLIAGPLFGDLSICEEDYERVHLGQSCMEHDRCYVTLGSVKDECDDRLLAGWQQSCSERYVGNGDNASYCLNACENAVDIMYNAMRYDDGFFCPSCIAFNIDQEKAKVRAHN